MAVNILPNLNELPHEDEEFEDPHHQQQQQQQQEQQQEQQQQFVLVQGLQFTPTDQQLTFHFVSKNILGQQYNMYPMIQEFNFYAQPPSMMLPLNAIYNGVAYIFSPRFRLHGYAAKARRTVNGGRGHWRSYATKVQLGNESTRVTLVYYNAQGVKTNFYAREYVLNYLTMKNPNNQNNIGDQNVLDRCVLYKLYFWIPPRERGPN